MCKVEIGCLFYQTHLSKCKCGYKQKCTQLPEPFSGSFSRLINMVCSILFRLLTLETTLSLVQMFQQLIRNFHFKVLKANARNKMDGTRKSMQNCTRKWWRKLCAFFCGHFCLWKDVSFVPPWVFWKEMRVMMVLIWRVVVNNLPLSLTWPS